MSDWIWYAAANRQQGPVHALFTSFYLQWAAYALKRSDSHVAAASRPGNCSLTSRRLIMAQAPLLSLTRH